MAKNAISVTLDEANLVWLRGVTERSRARSVSETLDRLITWARQNGVATPQAARSVAGTIDLAASDPSLDEADDVVRALFAESLAQPVLVKEARVEYRRKSPRRG